MTCICVTLPDGRLAIIRSTHTEPDKKSIAGVKSLFELSRNGDMNTHFILSEDATPEEKQAHALIMDRVNLLIPECHELEEKELPRDRVFRDAWEWGNSIDINMDKARIIHMDRIRKVRDEELAKEDIEFQKAMESGTKADRDKVAARKQALRDIPQNFNLEVYLRPDDLQSSWPPELP
tara:strand:+ start:1189 stop:1725 length:537 start_codon:yes stop_codon:yes gene_type:complete